MRGIFFCEAHKMIDNKQAFRYRNKTILFDLNTIKPKIGKIKNENLIIYDSFINQSDVLLLLVNYSNLNSDPFWVTSVQIQASKVDNYIDQPFRRMINCCQKSVTVQNSIPFLVIKRHEQLDYFLDVLIVVL